MSYIPPTQYKVGYASPQPAFQFFNWAFPAPPAGITDPFVDAASLEGETLFQKNFPYPAPARLQPNIKELDAIFVSPGAIPNTHLLILIQAVTLNLTTIESPEIGQFKRGAIIRWVADGTPQGKLEIYNCLKAGGAFVTNVEDWYTAVQAGTATFSYPCEDAQNQADGNVEGRIPAQAPPPPS